VDLVLMDVGPRPCRLPRTPSTRSSQDAKSTRFGGLAACGDVPGLERWHHVIGGRGCPVVGARKRGKERGVLRTPACDLLGMEVPIVQAAIWPAMSPELVAAVG
jgi:hypothetical protein